MVLLGPGLWVWLKSDFPCLMPFWSSFTLMFSSSSSSCIISPAADRFPDVILCDTLINLGIHFSVDDYKLSRAPRQRSSSKSRCFFHTTLVSFLHRAPLQFQQAQELFPIWIDMLPSFTPFLQAITCMCVCLRRLFIIVKKIIIINITMIYNSLSLCK